MGTPSRVFAGQKYGHLTVLERTAKRRGSRNVVWLCRCDCGQESLVIGSNLRAGNTKSCGCRTGKKCSSPTYNSWKGMLQRCRDPKHNRWKYYGGRGIKVCRRWYKFENFLADMGERPHGKTLDRKRSSGNYCKSNCQWATYTEQNNNRR